MKRLALTLTFLVIFACVEPPPPCGENEFRDADGVCQCLDGYERDAEGVCVEIPPPPPPSPSPEDYYMLSHAGTYVEDAVNCKEHSGMVMDVCQSLCPWACWRDPEHVAIHCPWGCLDGSDPLFDLTADEMLRFSQVAQELHDAGKRWMRRLPRVNRRADPSHPEYDPRFEKRSDVRKTVYPDGRVPEFKLWQEAHAAHRSQAYAFRYAAQSDPIREICAYDSIRGWCECRNKYQ